MDNSVKSNEMVKYSVFFFPREPAKIIALEHFEKGACEPLESARDRERELSTREPSKCRKQFFEKCP